MGPPNSSQLWRDLVTRRDPGTREVDPTYSAGLTVRFAQDEEDMDSFAGDTTLGRPEDPLHPACERPGGVVVAEADP